ncbi:histidine--tRNA ligase [Rhizosphaericola mali]|uniref:Histidine--tRNA ligase n=1 Tax=Rhizosphaericola mali TaxID=2545455 RepID=A0A5P2GGG8_9BACT|nr:histidine--tRNA ligase [Rhizosphaericola mali]QES90851.1 histidine--tRNA ligase [Rhizosphaericola mali]
MKPSIPQGTRDFNAAVVLKRQYIFQTIKSIFELFGFQPLETPSMENIETLMGKYGEEGDKLIFKILNNGLDNPSKLEKTEAGFKNVLQGKNDKSITERALRYDLTIPFARFVAMNQNDLVFPYRRYQIQPVWRADRPQRGRYREFYQCDADIVGSNSLLNETELLQIYSQAFSKLKVDVEIHINSRKMLSALAEICGGLDRLTSITIAIDKLDKIGLDKVKEELAQRDLESNQIEIIEKYLQISGSNTEKIAAIKSLMGDNASAKVGLEEIEFLLSHAGALQQEVVVDFTLARGLDYYTGIIFEVKAKNVQMGSIGGGGRYDNLTGLFGVNGLSGVGVSFGIDRIYDVMDELQVFPDNVQAGSKVLFFNLGEKESETSFQLLQQVRNAGIKAEIYPDKSKLDKQFKYADKKNIMYAVIIGSQELEEKKCTIKNIQSGEQKIIDQDALVAYLSEN